MPRVTQEEASAESGAGKATASPGDLRARFPKQLPGRLLGPDRGSRGPRWLAPAEDSGAPRAAGAARPTAHTRSAPSADVCLRSASKSL